MMRRLLKFLHTMGAIGFMGGLAAFIVLERFAPPVTSLTGYAAAYGAMAEISRLIFFPSLAITLLAGLLSVAETRAFHNAGWVGIKLATGIVVFEGGLVHIDGPIREEARRSAAALAGQLDPTTITGTDGANPVTLWVIFAVATVNVVLGIWRPRLSRRAD